MRSRLLLSLLMSLGCSPSVGLPETEPASPAPAPEAPAPVVERTAAPEAPETCPALADADAAASAYDRGVAKLDESRAGEHYLSEPFEAAIVLLREAAEGGHLQAQSLYGRTLFSVRFSKQKPVPEEQEDYVSAVAFLRIAATAGDAEAEAYMPGITAVIEAPLEMPLTSLPKPWVAEAFRRGDAWIDCYGESSR